MARKCAIVTGSSSGIGSAIAKKLASLNCNVLINYNKNISGAEETANTCKDFGVMQLLFKVMLPYIKTVVLFKIKLKNLGGK